MLVGDLREGPVEAAGGREHTHVGGRSLHNDRGDTVAMLSEDGAHGVDVVVREDEGLGGGGRGDSGGPGHREGGEPRAGFGEERIGVAVVVAGELDQQVASGETAGETDGRHGGLGAGGDQANLLDRVLVFAGRRLVRRPVRVYTGVGTGVVVDPAAYEFGELGFTRGGCSERQPAGGGLLHGGNNGRVRVTENRGTPRADEVHVLAALDIRHIRALRRDEEAGCSTDRPEGPHGRVHTARDRLASPGELEFVGTGHFARRRPALLRVLTTGNISARSICASSTA